MSMNNVTVSSLEASAVDVRELASNFTSVIPECCGTDLDPATELMNRHPVLNWLLNTRLTNSVRQEMDNRGVGCVLKEDEGTFKLKVPGIFWSVDPDTDEEACCFPPMDFAKCASEVPLTRLCVKDCDSLDHELLGRFMRLDRSYGEVGVAGETYNETRRRIARMSMAFYMARNMMLATTSATSPGLKAFHGLFEVMNNPSVLALPGGNILSAFATMACRLKIFGGDLSGYIIAVNPIIHSSILSVVVKGQYGDYPEGWTRDGDSVKFYGAPIVADRFIPFNMNNNTGEAWFLSTDHVGGWMATDLLPSEEFTKRGGYQEQTPEEGCGSECVYYYNYGTVFGNDASKIARIVNIPVSGFCAAGSGDLGRLINPTTLIPKF